MLPTAVKASLKQVRLIGPFWISYVAFEKNVFVARRAFLESTILYNAPLVNCSPIAASSST